jgi:hypothetical protein
VSNALISEIDLLEGQTNGKTVEGNAHIPNTNVLCTGTGNKCAKMEKCDFEKSLKENTYFGKDGKIDRQRERNGWLWLTDPVN